MSRTDYIWKWWFRNDRGEVKYQEGFAQYDSPDYFLFEVDPNDMNQEQIDEYNDPRYVHVDNLFDNEKDAREAALKYLNKQLKDINRKIEKLNK